jgi:hypothetical protein
MRKKALDKFVALTEFEFDNYFLRKEYGKSDNLTLYIYLDFLSELHSDVTNSKYSFLYSDKYGNITGCEIYTHIETEIDLLDTLLTNTK